MVPVARAILAAGLGLAACSTPDISAELTQVRTDFDSFSEKVGPTVATQAQAEHARVEAQTLAAGGFVVELQGDCDVIAARDAGQVISSCRLVETFDPRDDAGSATEAQDFLTIMDAYLTSLEDLAASDTPAQARAKADALVAAFGTADADRPAAFERLGARVRDRQDLIATSTEFFVNQVRVAALRRVMAKADAVIEDAVPLVAAHLAAFDEPLLTAQENLLRADGAVLDAIEAGDQAAHATAIANLRNAHTAFQKAEAASPITQLYLFRAAHARLLARTRIGADPDEFVDALEELRALRDAAVES